MHDTNFSSVTESRLVMSSFYGQKSIYSDPTEVFSASELSVGEKREILSSWASDARAVPNTPTLRMLDNGRLVSIHGILEALKKLDDAGLKNDNSKPRKFRPRPERNLIGGCRRSFADIAGMMTTILHPVRL